MKALYRLIELETGPGVEVRDLTPQLRSLLADSGVRHGQMVVASRHTTCAITVNENELRLIEDLKNVLARLVPQAGDYLHNDIQARGMPDEPRNAHSHIAAMLLGASQTIPVVDGRLALGTWQSVMFVELDGPRPRTAGVQITGTS